MRPVTFKLPESVGLDFGRARPADSGAHMSFKYVHTVLLVCPDCDLPVATIHLSNQERLKTLADEPLAERCRHCGTPLD
jgi:hypothetical protein